MSDKKNASQRIEDLEVQIASLLTGSDNMAQDLMRMKEALKLLVNKVDAVVKAVNQGGHITDEVLDKFMLENQVQELKNKVDTLAKLGILSPSDSVKESSLVVIRELDANGQVTAARNQFAFSTLVPMYKEKLLGAKVGDSIAIGEAGDSIEILEIYDIAQPQAAAPEAPEASPDATAAPADSSAQPAESASQSPTPSA